MLLLQDFLVFTVFNYAQYFIFPKFYKIIYKANIAHAHKIQYKSI